MPPRWPASADERNIDFFRLRQQVNDAVRQSDTANSDPNAVPSGGLLVPTVGVGGHCLPKDGILLWWRALEAGESTARSLILESRAINDASPAATLALAERAFGPLNGRAVALLGAAYRFNSEDTRNSPTLALARLLLDRGARVTIHDPYVYPTDQNLRRHGLADLFTRNLDEAVAPADVIIACTAHRLYLDQREALLAAARRASGVMDACNLWQASDVTRTGKRYAGIGRGTGAPSDELVQDVIAGFRAVETGVANEVEALVTFLNDRYAGDPFNAVRLGDVQRIAGTCVTGCAIVDPTEVRPPGGTSGFQSRLVARAMGEELAVRT